MSSLLNLFGKSPFKPIQEHMKKIKECVDLMLPLIEAFLQNNSEEIDRVSKQIYLKEHEADEIKNSIRDNLHSSLFLPVDRRDLLEVLSSQDAIADTVEDLAVLVNLREIKLSGDYSESIMELAKKVVETFEKSFHIVDHLDELVKASFSGSEAKKVLELINELGFMEWKVDKFQMKVVKKLYNLPDIKYIDFILMDKIIQKISDVSNASEKMGNRLRLLLSR